MPTTSPPAEGRAVEAALAVALAAAAIALACRMLLAHYADPDPLWNNPFHDRHTHFSQGLNLALALRSLDFGTFFSDLLKLVVWPPLHALSLAAVLLAGNFDPRLGIVPSLAGWAMTVVFAGLIARRMVADRLLGIAAALIAAMLTAASPALRLLASDVMLEGLGAGLSALSLWAFMWASAAPERTGRWRVLGLALTALFFHKGNYWGLVVLGLLATALAADFGYWRARAKALVAAIDWRAALRSAPADPLVIVAVLFSLLTLTLAWSGPRILLVFGRQLSLSASSLVTFAYAAVFIRIMLAWLPNRAAANAALSAPARTLLYWHVLPVTASLLIPKRLGAFLWFVGPANYHWQRPYSLSEGFEIYWQAFAYGFHARPWIAFLVLALAAAAWLSIGRIAPANRAPLIVGLVATAAVILHPQHQGRFLASWLFVVWAAAGAGAALIVETALASFARGVRTAAAAAAVAVVGIAAALSLVRPPPAAAQFWAARAPAKASDLAYVRPFLPAVAGMPRVTVVSTFGWSELFAWPLRVACRCRVTVDRLWVPPDASRAEVRVAMAALLARTEAARIVVIDAPPGGDRPLALGLRYENAEGILDAMATQRRFVRAAAIPVPALGAMVSIWERRALAARMGPLSARACPLERRPPT